MSKKKKSGNKVGDVFISSGKTYQVVRVYVKPVLVVIAVIGETYE